MTRFGKTSMVVAACTLGATAALAQTAGQTTPPATSTAPSTTQTAPSTAAPSTGAATSTAFTDSDVNNFAGAAIAVQKIQQDSTVAATDKQTKMASAVSSSGLTPEKFNAIAQASQSDPALMKRIQTAASAKMQTSGAPAAGSTGASGSASGGMSGSTGQ